MFPSLTCIRPRLLLPGWLPCLVALALLVFNQPSHGQGLTPAPEPERMLLAPAGGGVRFAQSQSPEQAMMHVTRGSAAENEGDWTRALEEYSQAYQLDTLSTHLLTRVVNCLFHLGRDDEVMSFARVVWKRDSTRTEVAAQAAEMAALHGRVDEAAEWMAAAARSSKGDPVYSQRLAAVLLRLGQAERADSMLARSLENNPNSPELLYQLGWMRARSHRPAEAIEPLQKLISISPGQPHALVLLAGAQEELKEFAQAESSYTRSLRESRDASDREQALKGLVRIRMLNSRAPEALAPLGELIGLLPQEEGLRRMRAETLVRLQRFPDALADLDTLQKLQPDNLSVVGLKAETLRRMGQADLAVGVARKFQKDHPGSSDPLELLGALELQRGRPAEALEYAERAVKVAPDSASSQQLRGQCLMALRRLAEAESAFDRATTLAPGQEGPLFSLGVARERQGHLDAAEQAFRKVLELNPRNGSALNYIGYMYADRGQRLEESLRDIDQALALEPGNPAFLDSRAWALFRMGRAAEALPVLEEALRNGGRDPVMQEHLGDVLAALQRAPEALEAYRKALAQDPGNAALQKKIETTSKKVP